jgi:outer membrane protein OmpA-like peptidoglycan-associated protein
MGDNPVSPAMQEMASFTKMAKALKGDPNGIGYLAMGDAEGVKSLQLTVDGEVKVQLDQYSVACDDYPLTNTISLNHYSDKDPNGEISDFIREVRSPRSEYLIGNLGYVTVRVRVLLPTVIPPLPEEQRFLLYNALRVNRTIRFAVGSEDLDPVESTKLDSLATYLRRLGVNADMLLHLGFSDDSGDPERNLTVSTRLAEAVAAALQERAVTPGQVVGLGAIMPLSSDAVPGGRKRNRRVETWIRPVGFRDTDLMR